MGEVVSNERGQTDSAVLEGSKLQELGLQEGIEYDSRLLIPAERTLLRLSCFYRTMSCTSSQWSGDSGPSDIRSNTDKDIW